jgi:uncharacterized protein (UPF0332 family)
MRNQISAWLDKARESQNASEFLLKGGHSSIAASQVFYTMFYIAKALLLSKDLDFSRESRVISAFGKEFKKLDMSGNDFHKNLIAARAIRDGNDFELDCEVDEQSARQLIQQSYEFYEIAQSYLKNKASMKKRIQL